MSLDDSGFNDFIFCHNDMTIQYGLLIIVLFLVQPLVGDSTQDRNDHAP